MNREREESDPGSSPSTAAAVIIEPSTSSNCTNASQQSSAATTSSQGAVTRSQTPAAVVEEVRTGPEALFLNRTQHAYIDMPSEFLDNSRGFRMTFEFSIRLKRSDDFDEDPVMPCQRYGLRIASFDSTLDDGRRVRIVCRNKHQGCKVFCVFLRQGENKRDWEHVSGPSCRHSCAYAEYMNSE